MTSFLRARGKRAELCEPAHFLPLAEAKHAHLQRARCSQVTRLPYTVGLVLQAV